MTRNTQPAVMAGNSTGWIRVSREQPCPVCNRDHNCNISQDGKWAFCGRISEGSIRQNAGGQFLHLLIDDDGGDRLPPEHAEYLERARQEALEAAEPAQDWAALTDRFFHAPDAEAQRQILSDELGVSVASLESLRCGWNGADWMFPERDASGEIIGISRRLTSGKKIAVSGSRRGLTLPPGCLEGSGDVLILEGASDTAAAMDRGLDAIGRPSNSGGAELLAEVLVDVPSDRRIIVMGEMDPKPDGKWPGKTGAVSVTSQLAERLGRTIYWAIPPDGAKDFRVWHMAHLGCRDDFIALLKLMPVQPGESSGTIEQELPEVRPLPDELPPVQPFTEDLLPEVFVSFVRDTSTRIQCAADYIAAALMCVVGSVVGRRCGIRPKRHDDWTVIPNLWGAVIGRPAMMKSPAIKESLRFLERLEADARKEHDAAMLDYEIDKEISELAAKQRKKLIQAALEEGRSAEDIRADLSGDAPQATPVRKRYLTNDSTVEKLGELLSENPNGVLVFRDELAGWLQAMDKPDRASDRAFHLEAWSGLGRFTYDRIGRGTIEIEHAIESVFGGIQPGKLSSHVRSAVGGGMDDDGLIQRFQLAVWPDASGTWENIDRWPDTEARNRVFTAVKWLSELDAETIGANTTDNFGEPLQVPYLRFDEEAQEQFNSWREQLEHRLRSGELHPAMESHIGKYRSLMPSLALLFHLTDNGSGPVTADCAERAVRWVEYLESHAARIYSAAVSADVAAAKALWRRILKGELPDPFDCRTVYRKQWSGMTDRRTAQAAIDILTDHGHLIEHEQERKGDRGRKPDPVYRVNENAKTLRQGTDKTDKNHSVSFVSTPEVRFPEFEGDF